MPTTRRAIVVKVWEISWTEEERPPADLTEEALKAAKIIDPVVQIVKEATA